MHHIFQVFLVFAGHAVMVANRLVDAGAFKDTRPAETQHTVFNYFDGTKEWNFG